MEGPTRLNDVRVVADDLLVYVATWQQHNDNFYLTTARTRSENWAEIEQRRMLFPRQMPTASFHKQATYKTQIALKPMPKKWYVGWFGPDRRTYMKV